MRLELPPLRERREDLPALVDHLLAAVAARNRRPVPRLAPGAREALERYAWPGNVRELSNVLERAVVLSTGDVVEADALPDALLAPAPAPPPSPADTSLEEIERRHVREVLAASATLEEAAARLGIDPTTLWRMRKRWGLD